MDQLAAAECPELVSIQEVNQRIAGLVEAEAASCGYGVVWDDDPGLDREIVLTTLEVVGAQRRVLADRFRSAYLVRVVSPIGVEAARHTFESSGDAGAAVRGRVDSISRTSSVTAEVAYSILLNDQVIFAGRIGEAVLDGGRWLVSKATFCDLVALSPAASEIAVC